MSGCCAGVVMILSVQHTGTWFVVDAVRSHPAVTFFQEYEHLVSEHPCLAKAYAECMHSLRDFWGWPVRRRGVVAAYSESLVVRFVDATLQVLPEGWVVLHQHVQSSRRRLTDNCRGHLCSRAFRHRFKTVVPVRDPLLSIMTAHRRGSGGRALMNIVDDFEFVSKWNGSGDVFFFPVDLYTSQYARLGLLMYLLRFVGLPYDPYVVGKAEGWVPVNTMGDYPLKRWYGDRRVNKVRSAFPRAFDYLVDRESVLRPFLESLGYRDLVWWGYNAT